MARQRTVFFNDMVAHVWANRSQQEGRNRQGNFYFVGDSIFSYGSHYEIARHVERKGRRAILFNNAGSTITTERNKRLVRRAIPAGVPVFHVDSFDATPRDILKSYRARFADLALTYSRARTNRPWYLKSMARLVAEANECAAFYGLRGRLAMPDNLETMVADCKVIAAREAEKQRKIDAKRKRDAEAYARKREQERQSDIAAWLAGGDSLPRWGTETPLLRIKGENVETSWGADFPVDHARRAFRLIQACRDSGKPYTRNGHSIHLGLFTIDAIDERGNVRAGCHTVEWSEVERIARELNILE
jgi:hypothetical protein